MARIESERLAPTYAIAAGFVTSCLRTDGSLFTPGEQIWTLPRFEELERDYVQAPEMGKRSFLDVLTAVPVRGRAHPPGRPPPQGLTMHEIAALMGRAPSTISRELARSADASGRYRPFEAQRRAHARRRLHRSSRLARDAELRDWVTVRLIARWSPAQVSRGLRRRFPWFMTVPRRRSIASSPATGRAT